MLFDLLITASALSCSFLNISFSCWTHQYFTQGQRLSKHSTVDISGVKAYLWSLLLLSFFLLLCNNQKLFGFQKLFGQFIHLVLGLKITADVSKHTQQIKQKMKLASCVWYPWLLISWQTWSRAFLSSILPVTSFCARSSFSCSSRKLVSWSLRFSLWKEKAFFYSTYLIPNAWLCNFHKV